MIKPLLALTLLCAPALADSPASYQIDFASKSSTHTLVVLNHSCGEVQVKQPDHESYLKVCANTGPDKVVRLEIERRFRENQTESRQSAVVVAKGGVSYDWLDGKITVKER